MCQLRTQTPTNKQPWTVTGWSDGEDLDADSSESVFVCEGCFHGFGETDLSPGRKGMVFYRSLCGFDIMTNRAEA